MNFSTLINGFSVYLENLNQTSGKNYNTGSSSANVYMYSSEFKQYLSEELRVDTSIFTKSINDILKMDVVNGKLVEANSDTFVSESDVPQDGVETPEGGETMVQPTMDGQLPAPTGEAGEAAISSEMVELLNALFENQDVINYIDSDESGDLNKEEIMAFLNSIKEVDGNADDLSLDDVFAGIQQIQDSSNVEPATEPTVEPLSDSVDVPHVNTSGYSGGGYTPFTPQVKTSKPKTPAEIKQEISTKEGEITTVNEAADTEIAKQEEAKKAAMLAAGISEAEYQAYLEEEQAIEDQITQKDQEISEKDVQIQDLAAAIQSNSNYISDLSAQIEANNGRRVPADQEGAAETNDEIDRMNGELQDKIDALEEENTTLEGQKADAETAKGTLEGQKEQLEQDKITLLNNKLDASAGFGKGMEASKDSLKAELAQYDQNIKDIRVARDNAIAGIRDTIKDLNVQLKDLEEQDDRKSFINENKFLKGLGVTGEELVEYAKKMLSIYGSSSGYCATGVSRTFALAYGLELHGNGCDWTANMDKLVDEGAFICVTDQYATSADLVNLPAGAVVTWDNTGGHNGGGAQYGHVTIADGHGGEISDHYVPTIYQSIGGSSTTYHVYIPVE